jgi:hypothetical protein
MRSSRAGLTRTDEADRFGSRKDSETAEVLDTAPPSFAAGCPIVYEQRRVQFLREYDRFTLAEVQLLRKRCKPFAI